MFVDTSGFYAFVSKQDRRHAEVVEVFRRALAEQRRLFACSYVVAETLGLVQHRLGLKTSRAFVDRLLAHIHIVWMDRHLHDLAWTLHRRVDKRAFTLVDAASAALMRERGVRAIIALNPEFSRLGFEVLPGASRC